MLFENDNKAIAQFCYYNTGLLFALYKIRFLITHTRASSMKYIRDKLTFFHQTKQLWSSRGFAVIRLSEHPTMIPIISLQCALDDCENFYRFLV